VKSMSIAVKEVQLTLNPDLGLCAAAFRRRASEYLQNAFSSSEKPLPDPRHLHALCREIAVELLRFLAGLQSPLSQFSAVSLAGRLAMVARYVRRQPLGPQAAARVRNCSGGIDRFQAIPIASMFRSGELRCLPSSRSLPL
jgi:hypothetical protein